MSQKSTQFLQLSVSAILSLKRPKMPENDPKQMKTAKNHENDQKSPKTVKMFAAAAKPQVLCRSRRNCGGRRRARPPQLGRGHNFARKCVELGLGSFLSFAKQGSFSDTRVQGTTQPWPLTFGSD